MAQIDKPNLHFNTITYSGNGSNPRTLTGVNFQPDWVWLKNRTNGNGHTLADSTRGANKTISSDGTATEITDKSDGHLDAFTSDGFTVGAGSDGDNRVNDGSHTYVAWNWKAGTTGSGTTGGSGTAKDYEYSVNTTAGFSIVKYKGNGTAGHTIPHHLGVVPNMIIIKCIESTHNWEVYHSSLGATKYLQFTTGTESTNSNRWNDTAPTSTVFTVGTEPGVNQSSSNFNFVSYCLAEKKGFSKFGLYSANGNSDGPFVYCGFKPAWILRKCVTSGTAEVWLINDNKRDTYNQSQKAIFPNNNNVEDTATHNAVDFLSNGFKMRSSDGRTNGSNKNYIYAAFAENPIVGSNDTPATAR